MSVKKIYMKSIAIITIFAVMFTCLFAFITTEESYAASKKIQLRKDSITLKCGDTYRQKLYDSKGNVIDTSQLKFSSSDKAVATVGSKGLIKAKKAGTATITVKYKGKTYKSEVTVKSRITFSKKKVTLTDSTGTCVKVKVDKYVDNVSYEIIDGNIVDCTLHGLEKNSAQLEIIPVGNGKTKIKVFYEGKGEEYDYRYITVVCEGSFAKLCNHEFAAATCTQPKTCTKCGVTEGQALTHYWIEATCRHPRECIYCGMTSGSLGTHKFTLKGICVLCGIQDSTYFDSYYDFNVTEPEDYYDNNYDDNNSKSDYESKLEEYNKYKDTVEKNIARIRAEGPIYYGSETAFNQEISALNNEISALNRKIMFLSADSSSSARAQKARYEAEKATLEAERDELYAQKSRASSIKALENELDSYYDRLFG